jgi:hypothetical protein
MSDIIGMPKRGGKTMAALEQVEQALATGKRVLFFLDDQLDAEPVADRGANAVHNVVLAKLLATYPDQFIVKSIADLRPPDYKARAKVNLYRLLLLMPNDKLSDTEVALMATLAGDHDIQTVLDSERSRGAHAVSSTT